MTVCEIITRVNTLNPNAFDEEVKAQTLCSFESRLIYTLTGKEKRLSYPDDMKTELCLPDSYADIYIFYLSAMLFFLNREYEEFNNHTAMYNALLDEYMKDFGRKNTHGRKRFYNLF